MARQGFGRIDPGVISGNRDEQRAANATIGRTRLLVALSCGGHTAEEFELQKHQKGDLEYQCLLDNACTNRIIGHIGECYKRTEIEKNGIATGKVRCRCVPAPDGGSSIRSLLDKGESSDDEDARNNTLMKRTIEWIFARVAHEASVEVGMIRHSNRASMHRIRRYFGKIDDDEKDEWPNPSLDASIYWSEYRTLFLKTLVINTIEHVVGSLDERVRLRKEKLNLETIASVIRTTRDSYKALLKERERKSIQAHQTSLEARLDYKHGGLFDLDAPVRTTDMSDASYEAVCSQIAAEPTKIRAYNATTILRFWGSHCSECTRGAKRGGGSSQGNDAQSQKRLSRADEHAKLLQVLGHARQAWQESLNDTQLIIHGINIAWIDALIGLIETIASICKLVKKCTESIRERDIKERNKRILNPGSQKRRQRQGNEDVNPDCAKGEDANRLILIAMAHIMNLVTAAGGSVTIADEGGENERVRTEIGNDQELAKTIRAVFKANVSNKLTGFTIERQHRELRGVGQVGPVPKVDDLVRSALVVYYRRNIDHTVIAALLKKKPRDVLEHALVHLLPDPEGVKYTSKRGEHRQELDDAKQCTIKKTATDVQRDGCKKCKCRADILQNRAKFSNGSYFHDDRKDRENANALKTNKDARSLLARIETEDFYGKDAADTDTIKEFVQREVNMWMDAMIATKAEDICLCATQCDDGECTRWTNIWGKEMDRWLFGGVEQIKMDLKNTKDIEAAQLLSRQTTKEEKSLVRGFLAKWNVLVAGDDDDEAGEAGEAGGADRRRGRRKEGAAGRADKQTRKKRKGSTDGDQDIDGILRVMKEQHAQELVVSRELKSACDRTLKPIRKRNVDLIQTDKDFDAMSRADLFGIDSKLREAKLWDDYKALDIFDKLQKYLKRRVDFENIDSNDVGEETKGRKKIAFVAAYAMCMQQTIPVPPNVRWVVARLKRENDDEIARDAATKEAYALVTQTPEFAFQDYFRDENDIKWITENALAHVLGDDRSEYRIADILDKMVRTPDSFAKLEPKIKEQVVSKCIDIYNTLSISKMKIRGPRGENVQIAMWVLASSIADARMMNRASVYFYLYGDERTVKQRNRHVVSLLGSEEIHDRVKRFVSAPRNAFFSKNEGLAVKQYIYGITPRGEKKVPLKVVGKRDVLGRTGPSKKATTYISDDTIIMYPSHGAITLDMLVSGYQLAHDQEKKMRDHINISMLSIDMELLDPPVMFERHFNRISLVHVKYPELKPVETCENALRMLGEMYKNVIEQAEANSDAPKTVRLCSLVKTDSEKWYSVNVERNLTVLALRFAFGSYRRAKGPLKLKYELYTADPLRLTIDSEYQHSESEYENAIRNVVIPDSRMSMILDVDSEINGSDQSKDDHSDSIIEDVLSGLRESQATRDRVQEEKERDEGLARLARQKAEQLGIQAKEQERLTLQARRNRERDADIKAFRDGMDTKRAQQKKEKSAPIPGYEDDGEIDVSRLTDFIELSGVDKTADDATENKKAERKEEDPESLIQECDDADTDEAARAMGQEEAGVPVYLENRNLNTFGASRRTSMRGKWI